MQCETLEIISINHTKHGGVGVDFRLRSRGGRVTRHVMTWKTADELEHFMSLTTPQELIRAALRERLKEAI